MDAFLQKRMVGRTCMSRRTVDSREIFHDFPWTEKSLSPYQGFGSVISRKPFVREQKTSLFFEFRMKTFGYLWDLAGFIHSHVCKRSLPAASSRAFLPLRH